MANILKEGLPHPIGAFWDGKGTNFAIFSANATKELDCRDVTWVHPSGRTMKEHHWDEENAPCLGMMLDGRAQPTGIRHRGNEATILIILNSFHQPVRFKLPRCAGSRRWTLLIDTKCPEQPDPSSKMPRLASGNIFDMESRSAALFVLGTDGFARRAREEKVPVPAS